MYNNKTILRSTFHFRKPGLPQTGAARKPENIHQTHYTHLYLCFTFELKPTPETNSKYDVIKMHNYETWYVLDFTVSTHISLSRKFHFVSVCSPWVIRIWWLKTLFMQHKTYPPCKDYATYSISTILNVFLPNITHSHNMLQQICVLSINYSNQGLVPHSGLGHGIVKNFKVWNLRLYELNRSRIV